MIPIATDYPFLTTFDKPKNQINMQFFRHLPLVGLAVVSTALVSCEDFLDRPPQDQITEENFYRSESELRLAAFGLYSPLTRQQWLGQEGWMIMEIPSDNSAPGGSDPNFSPIDDFGVAPDNEAVGAYWNIRYRAANLANELIAQAPQSGLPAEVVAPYVAEAQFVRALAYFDLVRIYGAVPLVLERARLGDDVLVPRAPVEEVYAQIEADLREAIPELPLTRSTTDAGRATSGAARALLAKVLLTRDRFDEAYDEALAVIESGAYRLLEDYGDLWRLETSDNNAESVFQAQHVGCGPFDVGNQMQAFFAPFGQGITGQSDGWGSQAPTSGATAEAGTTVLDIWEEGDEREYWTLFRPGACYPDINPGQGGYCYPETSVSRANAAIKKYVVGSGPEVCFMSTPQNANIIRYADVLLMLAEAAVGRAGGQSVDPRAVAAMNEVRARAGLDPVQFLSTENVLQERRAELAFEHQRWFDLLRQPEEFTLTLLRLHGKRLDANNLLFPIPSLELEINTNLVQNPGY